MASPRESLHGLPSKLINDPNDTPIETIRTAFSMIPEEKSIINKSQQLTDRVIEENDQNL
jgi:hypothetical protein